MDANASETIDYLLSQLHELKLAYVAVVADRESLAHVATELARWLPFPRVLSDRTASGPNTTASDGCTSFNGGQLPPQVPPALSILVLADDSSGSGNR